MSCQNRQHPGVIAEIYMATSRSLWSKTTLKESFMVVNYLDEELIRQVSNLKRLTHLNCRWIILNGTNFGNDWQEKLLTLRLAYNRPIIISSPNWQNLETENSTFQKVSVKAKNFCFENGIIWNSLIYAPTTDLSIYSLDGMSDSHPCFFSGAYRQRFQTAIFPRKPSRELLEIIRPDQIVYNSPQIELDWTEISNKHSISYSGTGPQSIVLMPILEQFSGFLAKEQCSFLASDES